MDMKHLKKIVAGIGLLAFMLMPRYSKKKQLDQFKGLPIAHRGLHDQDSEENTLRAFKKAVDAGYGIECDVQLTADELLVIFHDATLERMLDIEARVDESTLDELQRLQFLSRERIPTLQELLELVNEKVLLVIELKGTNSKSKLPERVYEVLKGYRGPLIIESFNPMYLRWFKRHAPHVIRGQLSGNMLKEKKSIPYLLMSYYLLNFLSRPDFLSHDVTNHHNPALHLLRALGTYTMGYTVKSRETYDRRDEFDNLIFEQFRPWPLNEVVPFSRRWLGITL